MILVWVDDCLIIGRKEKAITTKNRLMQLFDCEDIGEIHECVGCMIERNPGTSKMTQPLQLKKFEDEFNSNTHQGNPNTPAEPNSVLNEGDQGEPPEVKKQADCQKGIGVLPHVMRWSRPEIPNDVKELS